MNKLIFEGEKLLPMTPEWKADYISTDHFNRPVSTGISIDKMIIDLITQARRPLREIHEREFSTPGGEYIRTILAQEFQILHRNTHRGDFPKSIILEYPTIVRRIGKFSLPIEGDQP